MKCTIYAFVWQGIKLEYIIDKVDAFVYGHLNLHFKFGIEPSKYKTVWESYVYDLRTNPHVWQKSKKNTKYLTYIPSAKSVYVHKIAPYFSKHLGYDFETTVISASDKSLVTDKTWFGIATVRDTIRKDFGMFSTKQFIRVNSNIYKNIFVKYMFDFYNFQDKLEDKPTAQENHITQINHNLEQYDLVYTDKNGFYKKALADDERYSVAGIVTEIINPNEFILMTNGLVNIETDYTGTETGVLYLSDKNPGKFCLFRDITSSFYSPIGFIGDDDKVIINIMDSSVGDTLKPYQEPKITKQLQYITSSDVLDIINITQQNSGVIMEK